MTEFASNPVVHGAAVVAVVVGVALLLYAEFAGLGLVAVIIGGAVAIGGVAALTAAVAALPAPAEASDH
jgi:hypothetical protein